MILPDMTWFDAAVVVASIAVAVIIIRWAKIP